MSRLALVIEDDDELFEVVKLLISDLGYQVDRAADGLLGAEKAVAGQYAFIILDLMLPSLSGSEVIKRIRQDDSEVPVIMLTAKADLTNKVLLLELGADDFVAKPFEAPELTARINAVLRRSGSKHEQLPQKEFCFKELRIDFERMKVWLRENEVDLTAREYDILVALAARPGVPITRAELIEHIYGHVVESYEQSINSHINRIRGKIERDPTRPEYVLTVRGVGYVFAEPSE